MAKRGRKTLFKKEMIAEGYKLGALGLKMDEIALFWDVSERSLERWAKKNPDFCRSINKGRMEADLTCIQTLLQEAKKGNLTGLIFWLKNRRPHAWRERIEHSGKIEGGGTVIATPHAIIFSDTEVKTEIENECQPLQVPRV